ncbi:MAG: hypothetical protein KAI83_07070 [Thiomargarita sp.]|nr:hypothetical protein [Thiomargarita sp.]
MYKDLIRFILKSAVLSHVGWATWLQRHFFNEEGGQKKGLCPPYMTT